MHLELRHLRYFLAVAEELHFRRAAERLNIAQPALSRAVRQLEAELGVALLKRSSRQVALTAAGEAFQSGCREVMNGLARAVARTRKVETGEVGHLAIGYTDFAISGALPQIIQRFRKENPEITVELDHGVTNQQLPALESGRLDFGFVTGPIFQRHFQGVVVDDDPFVVVLPRAHRLARQKEIALAELAEEPFVLGTPDTWTHYLDHLYRLCRSAGFEPRVVQSAFNSEGIFGLVASNMGVTIHTGSVRNYIRKDLLVRPLKGCERRVPTVALWRREGVSHSGRKFIDFVRAYVARSRPRPRRAAGSRGGP